MAAPLSNLDLINACDVFPYPPSEAYFQQIDHVVHLRVSAFPDTTLGYLLPSVALTFEGLPDWELDLEATPRTLKLISGHDAASRSEVMAKTTAAMRATGHFKILEKWRDELYAVYAEDGQEVFRLERSSSQLFGVPTFGVHMTAFRRSDTAAGGIEIWVPRRSKTKETFPGMLDNSVAGGISAGEDPFDCLIREGEEEASLPPEVMKKAIAVGAVTYFYVSGPNSGGEEGLLQPECELVYDLDLTGVDVEVKPNDSEVASFEIMDLARVEEALRAGEFKPNCALCTIDFLIRQGWITAGKEPHYYEIVARLHRRLEFPMASYAR